MTLTGTPDWMRRTITDAVQVVGRTALANGLNTFASVPAGGVPTGYHGLVIAIDPAASVWEVLVVGKTSGITWGEWVTTSATPDVIGPMACMYESAIDAQVTITVQSTAAAGHVAAYAVGDTPASLQGTDGPRGGGQPGFVRQVGGYVTGQQLLQPFVVGSVGEQFVVPVAPSSAAGVHPPNDMNLACADGVNNPITIANAPGAGQRYRLWAAAVWVVQESTGAQEIAYLSGLTASVNMVKCFTKGTFGMNPPALEIPTNGLPCPTNTAIVLHTTASATGLFSGFAAVTIEAV